MRFKQLGERWMVDGPQIDRGAELFARGVGQGGDAGAEQIKANEHETPELIVQGMNRLFGTSAAKFIDAIPIIGPLLSGLIPTNPGRASAFGGLESEGWAGKSINPGKGGTPGSNLYTALIAPLIANRAITDHTGGTGGSSGGDTGGWGGDGGGMGGGGGGFESFAMNSGMADMFIAAGGGNHFEYRDVPMASLGTLSPQNLGETAPTRSEGLAVS
jgi:hypothetical protein